MKEKPTQDQIMVSANAIDWEQFDSGEREMPSPPTVGILIVGAP